MADVFISYSQQAPEPTVALATALVECGFSPTYDVKLLPGDVFGAVIDTEIDAAKAVITIWSAPALESKWVRAESERANRQKKLICVRTSDVDPSVLPTPFNAMHASLHSEIDDIVAKLRKLGVRPSGTSEADLPPEDLMARHAARDWRGHVGSSEVIAEIEAYRDTYRVLPLYRRIAETRISLLRAKVATVAPVAKPVTRIVRPEDVILRIDAGMHTAAIRRVAVTADDRILATGSHDKTVRLWDLERGALIQTLRPPVGEGHEGKVFATAIDPSGGWVAVGGWLASAGKQFVMVFDVATGALSGRLGPLPNVVHELKVSPDGRRLAAGLYGANGIRVWSVKNGVWDTPAADVDYGADVYGLSFASDGRLASVSHDGFVRLYSSDLHLLAKVKLDARPQRIAFSPNDAYLAIGYDNVLRVDVLDGSTLASVHSADIAGLPLGTVSCVAWLRDGRLVAGGRLRFEDGMMPILIWEDEGRGARTVWSGPKSTIMDMASLRAGGLIFGSGDPSIGTLTPEGARAFWRGPASLDLVGAGRERLLVSANGKRVHFAFGPDGIDPHLFDLRARALVPAPTVPNGLQPPNVTRLKISGWFNGLEPTVTSTNVFFKSKTRALELEVNERARSLAISPDAKSFVIGTEWSLRRYSSLGDRLWTKPVPSVVWAVNITRNGRLILAASADGTIRWHRASDGAELLALFIHIPPDTGAAKQWILFTPDGYYDCSPGADSLIGWHLNRGPEEAADFYPAETFATTFKKPAIIDAALDGV